MAQRVNPRIPSKYLADASLSQKEGGSGASPVLQLPPHLRVSFESEAPGKRGDDAEDVDWDYVRMQAMRIAVRQAEVREEAARDRLLRNDSRSPTKKEASVCSTRDYFKSGEEEEVSDAVYTSPQKNDEDWTGTEAAELADAYEHHEERPRS